MMLSIALMLMPAGTVQTETPQPAPAPKMICKTTVDTGSIARRRKQCMTRAQWDRVAEAARAHGRSLTDQNAAMSTNGT